MKTEKIKCLNCEVPFEKGFKFCPNCGQKTNEDLTIGVLFYNTISNYFSFDARFLKSFFPLMFKPGYLAKRFLEGKRLLYLHPAQMYLFVSVIFFFLFSFTVNDWIKDANKATQELATSDFKNKLDKTSKQAIDSIIKNAIKIPVANSKLDSIPAYDETQKAIDSVIKNIKGADSVPRTINFGISKTKLDSLRSVGVSEEDIYKEMGMEEDAGFMKRGFYKSMVEFSEGNGAGNWIKRFADTIPIAMFFLLPIFALILKIFYFRRGRYAYHLVFSFYFFSFLFTVFGLLLAFDRFIFEIPVWISVLIVLSIFLYFYLALLNFYKHNWFFTFIKSGIITFLFLLFVIPLSAVMITAFAFVNA
ncbi:MAG: DUF3667 domain-containing protein [Winogradskyella sp.]|uniref:DUF3667 domain-containing protein n=1 Tax=Winogradskyella sp. TaxID=1883156 RepID=UPI001792597B|nr:DUF3667 domain-containing protein [Winogradskyella sp.]MBT8244782.1 DUF3667 domain-containing protein [Winogradskyella sp.]NNK22908.1 DUF3667 domain-containing protein [Winogradskyella sp.]